MFSLAGVRQFKGIEHIVPEIVANGPLNVGVTPVLKKVPDVSLHGVQTRLYKQYPQKLPKVISMRRIVFESSISMDGFTEGPAGELDWITLPQQNVDRSAESFLSCFDTIFFGRKTYERMGVIQPAGRGPSATEKEFLYMMHGIRKYVFSRTVKHVAGNAMVISGNIQEEVLRIREEKGKDIWFCGGADLLKTFMALDLIDDYLISVQPVLLKSGKPLFPGNKRPPNLKLVTRRNLKSGVITFHYQAESRLNVHNYEGRSFEDKRFTCK